jgi:hypothetical protein
MQFSPLTCYIFPLRPKYSPQYLPLKQEIILAGEIIQEGKIIQAGEIIEAGEIILVGELILTWGNNTKRKIILVGKAKVLERKPCHNANMSNKNPK